MPVIRPGDGDGVGDCSDGLGPGTVFGPFEQVVGHLAFDATGLAAEPAWWQKRGQQVVAEPGQGRDQVLRGKRRRVRR